MMTSKVMITFFFFFSPFSAQPCLTPKCISIASSIIESLDPSVDPCVNFYEYSCGGWIKRNPLPDGHASWGTFGKLTQDNQLVLKNVLGRCLPSPPTPPAAVFNGRPVRLARNA